jgi:class 3 adenylate cyclase/alpha-beta hydrolase superfamily lysophospholipase
MSNCPKGLNTMELQIKFCKTSDGIQIAYATLGHGSPIVFCPGWVSHLQMTWETRGGQAFLEPLARSHTVIVYDRPGSGLSERKRTDFSLESEIRPLQAVVDHLKLKHFILLGYSQGGAVSVLYSTLYPRRVTHLILYDSFARGRDLMSEELLTAYNMFAKTDWVIGSKLMADLFVPAPEASDRLRQMFADQMRECMNQDVAAPFQNFAYQLDVTDSLSKVRIPTLVMHRRGDRIVPFELGRKVASSIPGSQFIQLEGSLHPPWLGDVGSIVRAISEFLGDPVDAAPIAKAVGKKFVRKLTAILSADVKGYSRLVREDEEGTIRTLTGHKEVMTGFVQHHRGRVAGTAGDSVLAEFTSVVDAVQCAVEIQQILQSKNAVLPENLRVEFRIGINLDDVIEEGDTIYGDGVNIAARLEALAEAGGICISGIVFDQIEKNYHLAMSM